MADDDAADMAADEAGDDAIDIPEDSNGLQPGESPSAGETAQAVEV